MTVQETTSSEVVVFTDHAAARAFEFEIDHDDILAALAKGHFKQPALEYGRFVHFIKVGGRLVKVVTAPLYADPTQRAIITIMLLSEEH